ncbi:MAG: AAA family ATPase [Acidimicrobiia bacterium]|nr:AAA family ATPase [Acidimicrobiia bacterium]
MNGVNGVNGASSATDPPAAGTATILGQARVELTDEVRIVGPEGAQVTDLGGRQVRLVLALLATEHRRPVAREELAEAIWPGRLPSSWEGALRGLVSKVRSVLTQAGFDGEAMVSGAFGCYQLRLPPEVQVDIEVAADDLADADEALAGGELRLAEAAAAVGVAVAVRPFLPGDEGAWVDVMRERLRRHALHGLEVLAQVHLGRQAPRLAVADAERMLTLDPFRESAYRLLMAAHAAAGSRGEALRAYERCRHLLAEELGVSPAEETEAAYVALLGTESTDAARSRTAAPPPASAPLLPAIPEGIFVGRRSELAQVANRFERVAAGRGQLVVLTGEAGIGKTALALESIADLRTRGATVLYGRCSADAVIPYEPVAEALARYMSTCPTTELREEATRAGTALLRLLPELATRLPDMHAGQSSDPESDRALLFGAVTRLLASIARRAPLLLAIDDVHLATTPTLLLIRQIVRATAHDAVLVILTRRPEPGADELDTCFAELDPTRATELEIEGLDLQAVGDLVGSYTTANATGGPSLADTLHARTSGHPLLLRELLAIAQDDGADLATEVPTNVRQLVTRRLRHLPEPVAGAMRLAAVLGRDFDFDLLGRCSMLGDEELLDALDQGVVARLIAEAPDNPGRYSFRHALVRDAVYEELGATRRALLHHRVAQAIEDRARGRLEQVLPELAFHFLAAGGQGDVAKAIDYAQRAADQATSATAYEEAATLLARALDLVRRGPADAEAEATLLLCLGEAQTRSGTRTEARQSFLDAAAVARAANLGRALARSALGYGLGLGGTGFVDHLDPELVGLLEEALTALGDDDSVLRARLLARLAIEQYYAPGGGRREELGRAAVAVAARAADVHTELVALYSRHWSMLAPEGVDERLELGERLLFMASDAGDAEMEYRGHHCRLRALIEQGRLGELEGSFAACRRLAGELRQPFYLWHSTALHALRHTIAGEPEAAKAEAARALELGERREAIPARSLYATQMFNYHLAAGDLGKVVGPFAALAESQARPYGWACAQAWAYAELDRRLEAEKAFGRVLGWSFDAIPRDGNWVIAVAMIGLTCAYLERRREAEVLYAMLEPFATQVALNGPGVATIGSASIALGALAATFGRHDDAVEHLRRALVTDMPLGRAIAARELARVLIRPDPREARVVIREGLMTTERHEMWALRRQLLALRAESEKAR